MGFNEWFTAMLKAEYPSGHPDFIPMCIEEVKLHSDKNADYAYGGDPLGNFNRVSELLKPYGLHLMPNEIALIYMLKQLDAVMNMLVTGYEGQVEGIKARLQDIAVYAKLIWILHKERPKKPTGSIEFVEENVAGVFGHTRGEQENIRKFGMPPFYD